VIEVRNLVKVFDARGHEVRAVDEVSTRVLACAPCHHFTGSYNNTMICPKE